MRCVAAASVERGVFNLRLALTQSLKRAPWILFAVPTTEVKKANGV
jgi:hypothetical protein